MSEDGAMVTVRNPLLVVMQAQAEKEKIRERRRKIRAERRKERERRRGSGQLHLRPTTYTPPPPLIMPTLAPSAGGVSFSKKNTDINYDVKILGPKVPWEHGPKKKGQRSSSARMGGVTSNGSNSDSELGTRRSAKGSKEDLMNGMSPAQQLLMRMHQKKAATGTHDPPRTPLQNRPNYTFICVLPLLFFSRPLPLLLGWISNPPPHNYAVLPCGQKKKKKWPLTVGLPTAGNKAKGKEENKDLSAHSPQQQKLVAEVAKRVHEAGGYANGAEYLVESDLHEICDWLAALKLPAQDYLENLAMEGFDNIGTIRLLQEEDLIKHVGITKTGHRKKIMQWVHYNRPEGYFDMMSDSEQEYDKDDYHIMTDLQLSSSDSLT